jgi:hypothetical protein
LEVVAGRAQVALETLCLIVDALIAVVQTIISAIGSVLPFDQPIPFVSDLYQFLTGSDDPLTPLDLTALAIAIPSTVLYIMRGAPPFPDDASVTQFQSQFTVDAPLSRLPAAKTLLAPLPAAITPTAPSSPASGAPARFSTRKT